jgi:hypothetical protein
VVLRWGGRSEAADLEDAVWMIGAYLAVAAVLGYLISLLRDVFARRPRKEAGRVAESAGLNSHREALTCRPE